MKSAVILFSLFVACALGQFFPSNVTQLTLGSSYIGLLQPQLSNAYLGIGEGYYVYIPESVRNYTLKWSIPSTSTCRYLDFYASTRHFPCAQSLRPYVEASDQTFFCGDSNFGSSLSYLSTGSSNSATYYPGDTLFTAGGYFYITVTRDSSSTFNTTCPFVLEVDVQYCNSTQNNSVGVGNGYSATNGNTACGYYTQPNVTGLMGNFSANFESDATGDAVIYKFVIPPNTQSVSASVNLNVSGYVYGKQFSAGSYDFYSSSGSSPSTFTRVVAGNYYFYIVPSSVQPFRGNVSISINTCPDGFSGAYCNVTVVNLFNAFRSPINITVPSDQDRIYACIDSTGFPSNFSNLAFVGNSTSDYAYYQLNGVASTSNSYQNLPEVFSFTSNDQGPFVLTGARYCFLLVCYYDGCTFSAGSNSTTYTSGIVSTAAASSSTGSSTGTTTYSVTSGTTTSPITSGSTTAPMMTTATTTYSITSGSTTRAITSGSSTTSMVTAAATTRGVSPAATTSSSVALIPAFFIAMFALLF